MLASAAEGRTASVAEEVADGLAISFAQAARLLPPARAGRPVNSATVWRWAISGIRLSDGRTLRLEAVRLSGRWLTSREALQRFIRLQTPDLDSAAAPTPRPPAGRRKAAEAADRELKRRGC